MHRRRPPRQSQSEDELVSLFLVRVADARGELTASKARTDRATARRIVRRLGGSRAAVLLVAARADGATLEEVERDLVRLDAFEGPDASLREAIARAARLRERGRLRDAARLTERALAASRGDLAGEARGHALLGAIHRATGALELALAARRQAAERARALGDAGHLAVALGELGTALSSLGRLAEARAAHEEALALHRERGDRRAEATELSYLGIALHRAGAFLEARRAHERARAAHEETGQERLAAAETMHLAYVAHELADLDGARELYREATARLRRVGDRALVGVALAYWAALDVEADRTEEAGARLAQAELVARAVGSARHEAVVALHRAEHYAVRGEAKRSLRALAAATRSDVLEPDHAAWAHALAATLTPSGTDRKTAKAPASALEDAATARAMALLDLTVNGSVASLRRAVAAARALPGAGGRRTRFALARAEARLRVSSRGLLIAADGARFAFEGNAVELGRRGTLRTLLVHLARARIATPGVAVPWPALLEVGWRGERVLHDAGFDRVRNAVAQLRRTGLGRALQTARGGYLLDAAVPCRFEDDDSAPP